MMKKRKPNRLKGYDYSSDNLYFVTSCVHNRICCFGEIASVETGCDLSLQSVDLSLQSVDLSLSKIKSLSELMGAYKTTVSKQIHLMECRSSSSDGSRPVTTTTTFSWQRSFHEHIIRDEKSFETIYDYIINNPINWDQDKFYNL